MALSDNKIIRKKEAPGRVKAKIVDGTIRIYKGAHLAYEGGNIGYVKLAADEKVGANYPEYAGIALEEKDLAAAVNTADGTFDLLMLPRGSGEYVEMDITSNITIANIGDPVYMDTDGEVDISSGIVHAVTNGMVGIIREFISTNKAWVQLTQHPIL